MVKYLGLDYLKLAVNRKQEFLNKALIAVPEHLEVIDLYTHKGSFEDERYRNPWKRASYDRNFLSEERSKSYCFEAAVPEINIGKAVEKFDSTSDTEDEDLGYFNLEDFVPSLESDDYDINSNKNDTKCDAEGSSKHDKNSKNLFKELHQKDNLHDDTSLKLEETLTEDVFVLLKSNLPSLKCLTGRLHQNQVKDPLSRKDVCNLQTTDNLRLCTPITTKKNIADCLQEEFVKVAVATDDEMLLEEALSPFSSPKEEKTSDEVTLLKDLNEISHNDLETGEISFPAASSDINMCGEKLQKEKMLK